MIQNHPCVETPEVSCTSLASLSFSRSHRLYCKFPALIRCALLPVRETLGPVLTELAVSTLSSTNGLRLPASPKNYSNKPVTSPCGNQGPWCPLSPQSGLPAPAGSLALSATSVGVALWGWCLSSLGYECTLWLAHCVDLICPLSSVVTSAISYSLEWDPPTNGVNRR